MVITTDNATAPWLLLIFSLPSKRTSERVKIWRKLQKYGTVALRNSGYVLPNTSVNQERFEWLATEIRVSKADYQNRIWITRPRPGIDRVSTAWLIKRFIDSKAIFVFDSNSKSHPEAVPFDMYQAGGFGHEGEKCTFETLCMRFGVGDKKVRLIGQAIHDADLDEEKFGRTEGITINHILKGWAKQDIPADELLRRGIDLIEGLHHSIA